MNARLLRTLAALTIRPSAFAENSDGAAPANTDNAIKVGSHPLHGGRINPMIYGGFIELLDDLVAGMWADVLNDRGFDGVGPLDLPHYYTGEPNVCDREWQRNETWAYDTDAPFNGTRSARLSPRQGQPASLAQSGCAARKGMTYEFSGYFRSDRPGLRAVARLKTMLPDGQWMILGSAGIGEAGKGWTKCAARFLSEGTSDAAVFEILASGAGRLWLDRLSLMPGDNVHGWRRDVVEAIRDSKPAMIRWGGAIIDPACYGHRQGESYRWKNGTGDRDLRTPFHNDAWGRIDSNDVGIDEFLQFCEAANAAPLVCVSVFDGVESTKDLVEYCNGGAETPWGARRAANGHPRPYGVHYWQVGNEISGDKYNRSLVEFAAVIRKSDPQAVILSSYPSQELLELAGDRIDFLCPHYYTGNYQGVEAEIEGLREMIGPRPIKLGVTEWNVTGGDFGLMRGKLMTLGNALSTARFLNIFQRNCDVVGLACRSNLVNSLNSGMIETRPGGVLKRASYHVMKLYADHSKPAPLKVENVPAGLDVTACAGEDGGKLTVFAVNLKGEPVTIALDLKECGANVRIAGDSEVVCDVLDRRQIDLMNHWAAPDRIRAVPLKCAGERVTLPAFSVAAIECAPR